jgi:hypothetical protein
VLGRALAARLADREHGAVAVVDNKASKPWVVRFVETVSRKEHTFKVRETKPDRTIGALILILESVRIEVTAQITLADRSHGQPSERVRDQIAAILLTSRPISRPSRARG